MATGCPSNTRGIWTPGRGSQTTALFPDPWADPASSLLPQNLTDAFSWSERIFERNGVFREAVKRKGAYFLTEVEITAIGDTRGKGIDPEKKRKYTDFLNDELGILNTLLECYLDRAFYGNVLFSVLAPTVQYVTCPTCSLDVLYETARQMSEFKSRWSEFSLTATCPKCERTGKWEMSPRRASESTPLVTRRWSPHEIELTFDLFTRRTDYYWKLPAPYKEQLRRGERHVIAGCYPEVLDAARRNQVVEFDQGIICHMRELELAGQAIDNKGWGIPPTLTQFGLTYYVQMLHLYNQALALDYVIPFRVISPEPQSGTVAEGGAPENLGAGRFASKMQAILRRRNTNPFEWHISPFPIKYQALGGDATQFAPKDLIEQGYDWLLASVGTPVEFYKANLSAQNAIPMLRVFESQNPDLWFMLNKILQLIVDRVAQIRGWEPVKARLIRPVVADDIGLQQLKLQLAINKQISLGTALRPLNIDVSEEQERMVEEEANNADVVARKQREVEQTQAGQDLFPAVGATTLAQQAQQGAQQGGAPQPGGAGAMPGMPGMPPSAGQVGQPTSMEDMSAMAQQWAQYLLPLDETTRKSQLSSLKQQNKPLQMLVVQLLDQMRQQQNTQGGAMLRQQGAPPAA